MVAFNNVLFASFTLFLTSLQVVAQFSGPIQAGSSAPTDCEDACAVAFNAKDNCMSEAPGQRLSCVCTDKNAEALATCYSCVIGLRGSPVTVQDSQTDVNDYVNDCKSSNINLDAVIVSASKTNRNGALTSGFVEVAAVAVAGMGVIYALLQIRSLVVK